MKKALAIGFVAVLAFSVFIIAMKPDLVPAVSKGGANVVVPSHAVEVAPGIFSLGSSIDVDGRLVEGFAVFHHKPRHDKGPGNGEDSGGNVCYAFLAKGAKWKNVESWIVNPANSEGLSDSFVLGNLGSNIQKWEDESGADILGVGSLTTDTLSADTSSPDNLNEVYFADISDQGAIAVTIVWGIFRGPPSQRGLVEWDMVFDDVDFDWSSIGESDKMDFENIAAHEIGHAVGMSHPDNSCTEETMYAFASLGETKKRDLNSGDIAGIQELY